MRDAIEMARESHLDVYGLGKSHAKFVEALERFAALVRKDEREAWERVCDQHLRHIAKLKRQHKAGILAEREACAKVCESIDDYDENVDAYYSDIYAAAIRARGQA
jgi:hypothetical protein